ncbi:MAG: NAD(P)H-hydrate dehydratase [Chitinophagaceae bacterium]
MKLLTAEATKAWDECTIQQEPISSTDLMERAAQACTHWIIEKFSTSSPFIVLAGTGNNGGDGLAIARLLREKNYTVSVYVIAPDKAKKSGDFTVNLERLEKAGIPVITIQEEKTIPAIPGDSVVIDALFGSGLNRALEGLYAVVVSHINASKAVVVSIDIPSGMFMDRYDGDAPCVKADFTLSFQVTKLPFLLPEYGALSGEVHVLDIGLSLDFPGLKEARFETIESSLITSILPNRTSFAHKGTYGHALLVAGKPGMMGAAVLAASSCTRSGAGKLTVMTTWEERNILQTAVPEAMVLELSQENISGWISDKSIQSIGIGPGWGTASEQVVYLEKIFKHFSQPIVIDADALNILSQNKYLWYHIPAGSILTPHPGEFVRLTGKPADGFSSLEQAFHLAALHNIYVVLKGRFTFIATPEGRGYFNTTGNPGMATGGSGDVLTGLLTGLLAQKLPPLHACLAGVWLHGTAGDIAATNNHPISMKAGDIIQSLPAAFSTVSTGY